LTGTRRDYRRRGLATAMKVRNIQLAKKLGVDIIETDNEENNPMFQLNLQLGFKPQPAYLDFHKKIPAES
jgi:GNAT superfamily N-acetyltransferase